MRRPMVFAAISFGSGIAAAFFIKWPAIVWIGGLLAGLLFLSVGGRTKKKAIMLRKTCIFVCILSMGGCWMQSSLNKEDPLAAQAGQSVELIGTVTEIQEKDDTYKLKIKTKQSRVLVSYYKKLEDYTELAGSRVIVRGKAELPQTRRNPGCFDYRLYLRACGIGTVMTADTIERAKGNPVFYIKYAHKIREHFAGKLSLYTTPDTKAILMGMIFGDKSGLSEDMYEDFQKNGTAHILAVSGLHVGVLYAFLAFLWRAKKGVLFYSGSLFLLLSYTALAEFSPSVVRAAVMITLHLCANILHQRYDFLSAAAFTFILMLSFNPIQLFHTGFQLSFLAVVSLGVILPFIERFYQGLFLSSAAIQAGMLPYTAYVFNYVSLGAFFANIPIVFLAGILLPAGISLVAVSYLSDHLFSLAAAVMEQGCRLLVMLNNLFYAQGKTSFDVVSPPAFFLAAYYGILFMSLSEKGRILLMRKKFRPLAAGLLMILLLAVVIAVSTDDGFSKAEIVFVDVGQGDCIHVRSKEGRNYLFDGGGSIRYDVGKKTLKPYLLKNGVKKVDAAFVSHLHEDHYGGIRSLAREGMIKQLGLYEGNCVIENKLHRETGTALLFLHKGQRVKLGEDLYVDILRPERKLRSEYETMMENQKDENASSLVMRLSCGGVSLLITGDIGEQAEQELLSQYPGDRLHTDILKVAHHGSKYSSSESFLKAVKPNLAVIQVGKNNFGHPSEAVIEKCRQSDIMVYRNDTSGAIGICPGKGGRGISVQKMIE